MTYTMGLGESLGLLGGNAGHRAMAGRVVVSMTVRGRWAEVTCSCGRVAVARWTPGTGTYRELVEAAWETGCGASVRRAV